MNRFRRLLAGLMVASVVAVFAVSSAQAGHHHHQDCCEPACCAPPPPVKVSWCVVDPVTCCKYNVEACVPACCEGSAPRLVDCRRGFLGRKILSYKFDCCNHCVDVVITHFGRVIVRD